MMRIYGSPQNALVIPYNARNLPHSTLYGRDQRSVSVRHRRWLLMVVDGLRPLLP